MLLALGAFCVGGLGPKLYMIYDNRYIYIYLYMCNATCDSIVFT